MEYLIIGIIVVVVVVIILLNTSHKSDLIGKSLTGTDYQLDGVLYILSDNNYSFIDGKNASINLYEKGIEISQGLNSVEVPLGAIYDVNVESFSKIVNKDNSVVGRAAVGGLLFGEIGAIIGGVSGLQTSQELVETNLFVMSLSSPSGKVIIGLSVKYGYNVNKFMSKYYELKEQHELSMPKEVEDTVYGLDTYIAKQIIEDEYIDRTYSISYNETSSKVMVQLDARNANFTIHLDEEQKLDLQNLLKKSIEWKHKAKNNKLDADKDVGKIDTVLSLDFENNKRWVDPCYVSVNFYSSFEKFNSDNEKDDEDFYSINIITPAINISEEDIDVSASVICLSVEEANKIISILETENITNEISKIKEKRSKVNDILK